MERRRVGREGKEAEGVLLFNGFISTQHCSVNCSGLKTAKENSNESVTPKSASTSTESSVGSKSASTKTITFCSTAKISKERLAE